MLSAWLPSSLRRGLWAAALVLTAAVPAHAQTGPFVDASPRWIGPIGGAGAEFRTGQIWIDVNGSDLTEPALDTFHPIPAGIDATWRLGLTPSRRVLIATPSTGGACPGTPATIRLFSIPLVTGANLVPLASPPALARCLEAEGFFDDPTKAVRTAYFREAAHPTTGEANILWVDLVTGVYATSPFPYSSPFGYVRIAPFGTMAWVQNKVNGPGGTNYSIVNLCPSAIGTAAQPGLTGQSGTRNAIVEGSPGSYTVAIRNDSNTLLASYAYLDCALPPPPTGACCLPSGGCLTTTSAECTTLGGTWTAGAPCTGPQCPPPPTPILTIALLAPATGFKGEQVIYELTARNQGNLAATNVWVTDVVPANATFVSANRGGTASGTIVTWQLGALAPGAAVKCSLTVLASCFPTSLVNSTYSITADLVGTVIGTPSRTTTLTSPPIQPVTLSLGSVPLAATPLRSNDRVRHTITLTNPINQLRQGLRMSVFAGEASTIVQIVDAAGGTVTSSFSQFSWTGSIAPSSSIQIVYETEIKPCRSEAAATERLNRGNTLAVTDACFQTLGTAVPPAGIPVAGSPLSARLVSTTHGPEQTWGGAGLNRKLVVRPGTVIDFEIRVSNLDTTPAPTCTLSLVLPTGLDPTIDPPFVGAPPAGTSWNSATRTISWKGTPPPMDSVRIKFRATMGTSCVAKPQIVGSFGSCLGALRSEIEVLAVPLPPSGGYLASLETNRGLLTWQPNAWQQLLCGTWEILRGMCIAPDGTYWVVGTPSFRLNPTTLDFQILPDAFFTALDMDTPYDVAADPRDSTLVFAGYKSGLGMRVRRYNPRTSAITAILNGSGAGTVGNRVDVANDGLIGVGMGNQLARIAPGPPAVLTPFPGPGIDGVSGVAVDLDQNFLVTEDDITGNGPRRLFSVNRTTGAYASIVDLNASFGTFSSPTAIAVSPNQDVYVGAYVAGIRLVQRGQGNAITALPPTGGANADLEWWGPAPGNWVSTPDAPRVPDGLTLSATPNPFVAGTTLRLTLAGAAQVDVAIHDLIGRRVRTLMRGALESGTHQMEWDGTDASGHAMGPGIYFARFEAGGEVRRVRVAKMR